MHTAQDDEEQVRQAHATYTVVAPQLIRAMAERLRSALKNLNKARAQGVMNPEEVLLLEVPYLILRGNKATLIAMTRKGIYYDWSVSYPHFWALQEGTGYDADDYDSDDPGGTRFTYGKLAPRPIWWQQMQPGDFTRAIRFLIPRTPQEKAKKAVTPALVYHAIQRQKNRVTTVRPEGIYV